MLIQNSNINCGIKINLIFYLVKLATHIHITLKLSVLKKKPDLKTFLNIIHLYHRSTKGHTKKGSVHSHASPYQVWWPRFIKMIWLLFVHEVRLSIAVSAPGKNLDACIRHQKRLFELSRSFPITCYCSPFVWPGFVIPWT